MTPSLSDISARATPLVRMVIEDDEVKDHMGRAASAGRAAVLRARSPKPSARQAALARAGEAVRETGQVLVALSDARGRRRRRRRRRVVGPVILVGAAAAAVAAALRQSGDSNPAANDDRPPPSAASPSNPQDREAPHG
jgi:hypothetical protein